MTHARVVKDPYGADSGQELFLVGNLIERIAQETQTQSSASLHRRRHSVDLDFSNQARKLQGHHENLKRCHASNSVRALETALCDDRPQRKQQAVCAVKRASSRETDR